ncbi:MAG TPA: hypothetical protein VM243_12790 [Phycisphaerae bacterium]|nr:hypothetical protein [Phycisphaerae bacterium]
MIGISSHFRDTTAVMNAASRPVRAISLVETLVAGILLALLLWLLAGLYDRYLDRARTDQAVELIAALDRALTQYHETSGAWPQGNFDGTAKEPITALVHIPAAADRLKDVSVKVLHVATDGRIVCRDPWGRRLRYVTDRIADTDLQQRVQRNGGRPIFESAGPDGRFGRAGDAATADDIRSDEPAS